MKSCSICSEESSGCHFGAEACRACAAFFRRSVTQNKRYQCRGNNDCDVADNIRCMCRACRYSKCLEAGMNPVGVQQKPELSLMLTKMNDAYRNLLATRITVLRGRSLFPRAIDYREAIEQGIKDVPLVANWVSQCFGKDFRELKEKNVLFENFYTRFCQLEITFTSHLKKTPDLIQLPSGDFIDMENLDRFYKDEKKMGKEEIERLFKPFYTMQKRSLILPMMSLNLDHFEFLALCTLILWDTSLEGLSDETVLLAAQIKDQVMKELAAHLKNSIRIAAIVNLLPAVERCVRRFQEDMEMTQIFDIYKSSKQFYDLVNGNFCE